jgi:PAS domain-containing protein
MAGPGGFSAEGAAARDLVAALEWLPLASLILTDDGTAVAANRAWTALSAGPPAAARGDGWLGIVEPEDRDRLQARLLAATDGQVGFADCRLIAGASRQRWSRWWWRPVPADQVIACVAELDGRQPPDPGPAFSEPEPRPGTADPASMAEALGLVVHRLFDIGLEIQSAASRTDGPVADHLQSAVDKLDELIRDARAAAFRIQRPAGR